jgi:micrococcal nuclease
MLFIGCNEKEQTISSSSAVSAKVQTQPIKNDNPLIKGNINSKGERIYHMPGQQFYKITDPEEMFFTEEEARDAGFRKSKR